MTLAQAFFSHHQLFVVSPEEFLEQVDNIDSKKASPIGSISVRILKDNVNIVAP